MWPPKHNQAATNSSSSNTTAAIQQPTNYVTTSTPVTQSSSPIRHFQHLGLPVASTQYKSPYAVPQSSSGSSAISSREAGPPMPLPMKLKTNNYHQQQQPPPHQYSSRQSPALPVSTYYKQLEFFGLDYTQAILYTKYRYINIFIQI